MATSNNLQIVESIIEAWERGDFSDASWADPEIEFVVDDVLSRDTWKGIERLGEGWLTFLSSWEDYRVEREELKELSPDRVLVLLHHGGRGKRSGVEIGPVRYAGAVLFDLPAGKVTRLVAYLDRRRAIEELGLEA